MSEPTIDHPIRQLATTVVYESPYLRLREDRVVRLDGSQGIYSYLEKPDFALIIAEEDNGDLHLVEQYRYPVRARSIEFVQGTFPGLADGDPEELAREELRQETGITAARLRHLGRLNAAKAQSVQGFDVFVATGLTQGEAELEPEEQDLQHRRYTRAEVEDLIRTGVITDNSTLAAYALYLLSGAAPG